MPGSGKRILIAPSILSANFAALGDSIRAVEGGGANLIHVDVMDGHFAPNITIGPPVVKAIKRSASVPLDVHLMITEPERYAEAFVQAGADRLSVHVEVLPDLRRSIANIKSLKVKVGAVINPETPAASIEEILGDVDYVLVMSVHPGFSGQSFIPGSDEKVRQVRAMLDSAKNPAPIEIDGGITLSNVAHVIECGVEIVVAGSAIFDTPDPTAATAAFARAANL